MTIDLCATTIKERAAQRGPLSRASPWRLAKGGAQLELETPAHVHRGGNFVLKLLDHFNRGCAPFPSLPVPSFIGLTCLSLPPVYLHAKMSEFDVPSPCPALIKTHMCPHCGPTYNLCVSVCFVAPVPDLFACCYCVCPNLFCRLPLQAFVHPFIRYSHVLSVS